LLRNNSKDVRRINRAAAQSVRRNLLARLSAEQIETIVRVSNIVGEQD
jgi:hypothetical protein